MRNFTRFKSYRYTQPKNGHHWTCRCSYGDKLSTGIILNIKFDIASVSLSFNILRWSIDIFHKEWAQNLPRKSWHFQNLLLILTFYYLFLILQLFMDIFNLSTTPNTNEESMNRKFHTFLSELISYYPTFPSRKSKVSLLHYWIPAWNVNISLLSNVDSTGAFQSTAFSHLH